MNKIEELYSGITSGDRSVLSRAITICESTVDSDKVIASQLLTKVLPHTGKSVRLGVSGTPGVGKSTFIEAFGMYQISLGKKVAVLAIDPSSAKSGGSILGDKTRMSKLSIEDNAFVRPSPSRGSLGGIAFKTKEAMLLCEAAGYDYIIVETVGVGQSEVSVSKIVDVFLLLLQSGAGDELQGIKRGILELVDLVGINKADGDNIAGANLSKGELTNALMILRGSEEVVPSVFTCSALKKLGIDEIDLGINKLLKDSSKISAKRHSQNSTWYRDLLSIEVLDHFINNNQDVKKMETEILENKISTLDAVSKTLKGLKIK
jgi:LAO/AO transport system kinase